MMLLRQLSYAINDKDTAQGTKRPLELYGKNAGFNPRVHHCHLQNTLQGLKREG